MKITRTRQRSRPIYRQSGGQVTTYVLERTVLTFSPGKSDGGAWWLPMVRRVFVIDRHGVHTRDVRSGEVKVVVGVMALLALLAWRARAK